ncbi:glycosyl hydrolase [Telmatobacter bradus]|uniref:glycosyl hydrolase n=1 Tax=Telmatobacter bradus TaxID=474953 RepID=UPI003B432E0B
MSAGISTIFSFLLAGFLAVSLHAQASVTAVDALRAGFKTPPAEARARCYWWWLNGNTTKEAITRDLEGMKAKGIGGAILVDADGSGEQGNREVKQGPAVGSPQWNELFVHALAEAQRLGLEISLNVTSRWDVGIIGGKTVQPEDAMKLLTWSRTTVTGGSYSVRLTAPHVANGFYRPIAVLAYPLHHGAALPGAPGSRRASNPDLWFKTATIETGFSMPPSEKYLRNGIATPGEQDAEVSEVLDLSAQMDAGGNLQWKVPDGTWEVLRIGYTDTYKTLVDHAEQVQGLPLDALSAAAFDHYWQQAVEPLLAVAKLYVGTSLRYLVTDSWEAGGANWTEDFREQFQRRRGYDPLPYLPVVAGRLLTSRAVSNQFLFDLRRTVADLITENYYDRFAEHAHKVGLGTHPESGGPHGAPIDALETFRSSSFPQTEFWADSGWHRVADNERYFVKEASSAAHIYGKPLVAAEGPTSMNRSAWSEALASNVQPAIDYAFTEGLNHIIWHEFTSSPAEYGKPGQEYFAGTHLNPNVTWWNQTGPFLAALNRAQFLLQQGRPVSDLLYFYSDQVPNFVRSKNDDPAHTLPGYDYDVVNEDALLHRLQFDGAHLHTPEGVEYRALALPSSGRFSLAALRWVEQFVAQGGVVIGAEPTEALGLQTSEQKGEFSRIAAALWSGCNPQTKTAHYEKGTIVCTTSAQDAFAVLGVALDFKFTVHAAAQVGNEPAFDYVHRSTAEAEIYFVRNTRAHAVEATLSFRVQGRTPELWSADDGSVQTAAAYRETAEGRTEIPLSFPAYGSTFVVFTHASGLHLVRIERNGAEAFPAIRKGGDLFTTSEGELVALTAGSYNLLDSSGESHSRTVSNSTPAKTSRWTLAFPAGWGAPASIPVESFKSWTESKLAGIRYFSGSAVYHSHLQVSAEEHDKPLWLELGDVREIATVRVNGSVAGTTWQSPYAVRIDGKLHGGENTIEIEVANLWPNRLIGDLQNTGQTHYTHTNISAYRKDSPLLPSGILKPVTVQTGSVLHWR